MKKQDPEKLCAPSMTGQKELRGFNFRLSVEGDEFDMLLEEHTGKYLVSTVNPERILPEIGKAGSS